MSVGNSIKSGKFDGFAWIRCEGRGNFLLSPALKSWGESCMSAGDICLVVDLESCVAMDSTFMGTLAGISTKLLDQHDVMLQIVGAHEKMMSSLTDLGLDYLLEINPLHAIWSGREEEVRALLTPVDLVVKPDAHLVLEAHEVLSDANPQNAEKFASVVDTLRVETQELNKSKNNKE